MFDSLRNQLRRGRNENALPIRKQTASRRRRRLSLETLEDRSLFAAYVVDTDADNPLATSSDTDGLISLREAIEAANTNLPFGDASEGDGGAVDSITFAPSLSGQTIALGGVELVISDDLAITGLGSTNLTISGANLSRVFSNTSGVSTAISDLTIADGSASDGGGIYNAGTLSVVNAEFKNNAADDGGGAIKNDAGNLTVENSIFSENFTWNEGGAIWNDGALEITGDSQFLQNRSEWEGGAIWNGGTLQIDASSFVENSTYVAGGAVANRDGGVVNVYASSFLNNDASGLGFLSRGGAIDSFRGFGINPPPGLLNISSSTFVENSSGSGAAIWNDAPATVAASTFTGNTAHGYGGAIRQWASVITITDSTLADNSATGDGGAIENYYATVELINSTISGNSARGVGGAIDNWGGTVRSSNATIVFNRADDDGNGYGTGGAIYSYNAATVTLLNNTLLAGNLLGAEGSEVPNDLSGVSVDPASSHNLIGDAATAGGLIDGAGGNIVGNAGAGTIDIATVLDLNLADNGGATYTHALVPGGLAIDAGHNGVAVDADGNPLAYDQRGAGFARVVGTAVDIGAFEVQPSIQIIEIDVKPGDDPSSINLASNGLIAVAIYTTSDFNAADVDPATVQFAGAAAVEWALEDVDGDGDLDMILHFNIDDTNLAAIYSQLLADDADGDGVVDSTQQTAAVSLTGETTGGQQILGTDEVDLFFSGNALRELLDQLALAGSL